jgi:hypothetical protein
MLTDIFATRYEDRLIWTELRDSDRILLVQGYRMVAEQLWAADKDGKLDIPTAAAWKDLHSSLSMELGRESLAPLGWNFMDMNGVHQWGTYTIDFVCKTFMLEPYKQGVNPDTYMKERISFVELAFRARMHAVAKADAAYRATWTSVAAKRDRKTLAALDSMSAAIANTQTSLSTLMDRSNTSMVNLFNSTCDELNKRFRLAKVPLNYHNGFIQIATDSMVQEQIEQPFWDLVAHPKWANVATDMTEAIDRREANNRDPAFWATKALESVIKIISTERGWTHGGEKGAHSFIDNLQASKNGNFIHSWEAEAMKLLFTKVRNPLGHGPGGEKMPELTPQQTNWAIEACMSWSKSLIERL